MGVSRLAYQSETGELQTQEVLKQAERGENQEGTIRTSTELSEAGPSEFEGQNNCPIEVSGLPKWASQLA